MYDPQVVSKCVVLLLVPLPYYVRLFVYFKFEQDEMNVRRDLIASLGLKESFSFYRSNVIQYFTPIHGIFIATYIFYFFSGLIIGFSDRSFRERLKDVARSALGDMSSVSQTGVLGIVVRLLLFPFKRFGVLGCVIGPFYLIALSPVCIIVLCVYCVPTVYLSLRLPYHAKKLVITEEVAEARKRKLKKVYRLGKQISKMDKTAHHVLTTDNGDSCCPEEWGWGGLASVRSVLTQTACSLFCLCILYSIALVFAESIGLFVEILAFTMMGIIVNAGSVLKYVSMVLLVIVYCNDCYSNVYDNYLTFNQTIIDEMVGRITADLRKIASMPSEQQENTAFQVKCIDEEAEKTPTLNLDKKEIRWKLGQLLVFLDCFDTPRVPLRLFQKLCEVRVHGAPGPVYINLLAATGKFMIIVVFLMFVMIVVMAFGNVYAMSSTNTTLATLAGGFVPMLLKNVLSSKGAKLSLKTVSFKGQIDEIIGEYKQYWPVLDLIVERDDPKVEEEDEGVDGGDPDETKDANSEKGDKKDEKGDRKDGDKKDDKDSGIKNEGVKIEGEQVNNSEVTGDDDLVDLFIDLSVADTACWSIYGSDDSLPDRKPDTGMMPGYFDPRRGTIDEGIDTVQTNGPTSNTNNGIYASA